jgi:hypothetical protein
MQKFKRPLQVILPKFKALAKQASDSRSRLELLGLSEFIEQDNY